MLPGGVLRRPFALKACERKAYLEAKKLYTGRAAAELSPEPAGLPLAEPQREFKDRMVDSIKRQES